MFISISTPFYNFFGFFLYETNTLNEMQTEWYSVVTSNYFYPCYLKNILFISIKIEHCFHNAFTRIKNIYHSEFWKSLCIANYTRRSKWFIWEIKLGHTRHHWLQMIHDSTTETKIFIFFASDFVIIRVNISNESKKQT